MNTSAGSPTSPSVTCMTAPFVLTIRSVMGRPCSTSRNSGRPQLGGIDWQLPHSLAGCSKDSIGDRGNDRRSPGLAHPARRLGTLDDMDLDRWRLIHPEHLVGIEVGLLDTAVLKCDVAI